MKKQIKRLEELEACSEAVEWARDQDNPQQAWDDCERGDWMLWLLGHLSGGPRSKSRKQIVLMACECARLSLKYVPKGEDRPRIAIETAEAWTRGEATLQQVRNAASAAYAAYAAAAAAAYAAYAAYAAASAAYAAYAYYAYAAYASAAAAYASAAASALNQCADIVRKHYPKAPKL